MVFHATDPQRSPASRWNSAKEALSARKGSTEASYFQGKLNSDSYFRLSLQGQVAICNEKRRFHQGFHNLSLIYPERVELVLKAHRLISGFSVPADNWLYQSLMLGRAPLHVMIQLLGVSEEFIKILNRIFFDVEERLEDKAFIWNQVIRTNPKEGLQDNVNGLWVECAFLGGFERMLVLRAGGNRKELMCSNQDMKLIRPAMKDYLGSAKTSSAVLRVIESRMKPNSKRTIEDLRNLYLSLPGQPEKKAIVARTSFESFNVQTGQRRRQSAEVLSD